MRRKRGVLVVGVLFVFLGVLLSGVGSGQFSCNTDQIILRLASDSNANGEAYNGVGNYPKEICYEKIFGSEYSATDPNTIRNCVDSDSDGKSDNIVLRLSDPSNTPTNSHAEGPQGDGLRGVSGTINYNAQICFGDLKCEMIDDSGGVGCGGNKKPVVRLFDRTNAHLQTVDSNRPVSDNYKYLICCSSTASQPPPVPVRVYWASGDDNNPFDAGSELVDNTEVTREQTIKLVAVGIPVSVASINFVILDDDGRSNGLFDIIKNDFGPTSVSGGKATVNWQIASSNDKITYAFNREADGNDVFVKKLDLIIKVEETNYNPPFSNKILLPESVQPPVGGGTGCDWYNNFNNVDGIDGTTGNSQPTQPDACNEDKESGRNYYDDDTTKYDQLGCGQTGRICFCEWKSNKCDLAFSDPPIIQSDGTVCNRRCSVTTSYGDCSPNDERELTIKGTYITSGCDPNKMTQEQINDFNNGQEECETEQKKPVSCLAPTINVPFFGGWQFMISVLGIVGIYFLVAWKERDKNIK